VGKKGEGALVFTLKTQDGKTGLLGKWGTRQRDNIEKKETEERRMVKRKVPGYLIPPQVFTKKKKDSAKEVKNNIEKLR